MLAGPVHVLVLTNLQKQVELLCKKRVVVLQLQAKQREGLDEGAAAYDARPCDRRSRVAKL